MVKNPPAIQEPEFNSWLRKIPWRKVVVHYKMIKSILGFPSGSVGKESACNVGDLGLIPWLGRSLGERNSYPLQYSSLENPMDCTVQGIAKSWTLLSNFHLTLLQSQTTASLLSYPLLPSISPATARVKHIKDATFLARVLRRALHSCCSSAMFHRTLVVGLWAK